MKTSIRLQLAVTTMALIAGTLILCWLMNNIFLEEYYESAKKELVQTIYERLEQAAKTETLESTEVKEAMMDYAFRHNMGIEVIDQNSKELLAVSFNSTQLKKRLIGYILKYP